MIVTLILTIVYSFLAFIVGALPNGSTLPAGLSSAITFALYSANMLDYIIPVNSLLGALGIVLAVEFALWGFHGVMWVYRHIPFIGH